MTRDEFKKLVLSKPIILDGATGTELNKQGLPSGVCPEQWVLENPQSILEVQKNYAAAGSNIIYTCTFGCNMCKLEEFELADKHDEMNIELAKLTKEAVGENGYAFGDMAPTGNLIEPFGDMAFEECVTVYKKQALALKKGGVDGFVIETMMDIQEARAALIGVREAAPDMPIIVTMTFGEEGRTLTGTDPICALITLQSLGADAVGCNCSAGPDKMIEWIAAMKPYSTVPLLSKPNAGQPKLIDGKTVFDMQPDEYSDFFPKLIEAGANLLGGCCGSSPAHIAEVSKKASSLTPLPPAEEKVSTLSSAQSFVTLGKDEPFAVIGERINPTGKKKLQAELREGKFGLVRQYALEQTKAGASLIDVNMGLSGIDEAAMMLEAVKILSPLTKCPLCLDSSDPAVIESALRLYPGRALINSVSAEKDRIDHMLPLAKKYGAMFILLPVTDEGVPEALSERIDVTKTILEEASKLGLDARDTVIDGLVMTVSSSPEAPAVTADFIEWCSKDLNASTCGGVSNISFGMPERARLNSAFLGLLIGRGLNSAIINPASEIMMDLKFASDALLGRDKKLKTYLSKFSGVKKESATEKVSKSFPERAFDAVLYGEEENIGDILTSAVKNGVAPQALVDESLIPAIIKVGELYDKKEYFLPQLMMSAQAMSAGFTALAPYLSEDSTKSLGKVVMATVKGDIHDIGKNIVCLMLKNYGFEVIDLGKDIPAEDIIKGATESGAKVVGLSALMTTTMPEMQKVIELAKEMKIDLKFMLGGAVVDKAYADEIGAEGYAEDAVAAVREAKRLCE